MAVTGNVLAATLQFKAKENEEFVSKEAYRSVDASAPLVVSPPQNALYVRVTLDSPVLAADGTRPDFYVITLSLYGCFEHGELASIPGRGGGGGGSTRAGKGYQLRSDCCRAGAC